MTTDNLDNYRDGANYARSDSSTTGLAFYAELADRVGGSILELGCGTGRICLPLAARGHAVTGLDLATSMLTEARREAKKRDLSIRWIEADGRDFTLSERFHLIYLTGNTFQAFLTPKDQQRLLSNIRGHLQPQGLLAFETRNPRWRQQGDPASLPSSWTGPEGLFAFLESCETEIPGETYTNTSGDTVQVSRIQHYDPVRQWLHWTAFHRWQESTELLEEVQEITLRYTFPQELMALLSYNGFEVIECYGNWDRSPLQRESPSIIVVCTLTP